MTSVMDGLARAFASGRTQQRIERYLREARRPIVALVFLLPGVIAFELWAMLGAHNSDVVAHSALRGVLGWLGIVNYWGPGLLLVATLLVQHHRRRDRLRVTAWVFPAMVLESFVLALPLVALSTLFAQRATVFGSALYGRLLLALGAGVYEELVFRLLLITGLAWLARELLQARRSTALWIAVLAAAALFALCHYHPIGTDPFDWASLWFRIVAALYLSAVYLNRGLGIAAGSHAVFNIILVLRH